LTAKPFIVVGPLYLGNASTALLPGARSPSFDTWDGICELYAWPQTFVTLL
jgi:hypothetical protein